jgi:hypothetical protein
VATSNDEGRRQAVQYGDQRVERGPGGETHRVADDCKFVGYTGDAVPLFEVAGLSRLMDNGFVSFDETAPAEFISRCGRLRFWSRQLSAARARAR